jgi:hypothetical protein
MPNRGFKVRLYRPKGDKAYLFFFFVVFFFAGAFAFFAAFFLAAIVDLLN